MEIKYCFAENTQDLQGILDLQSINHKDSLDENAKTSQGFVTVKHSLTDITDLNNIEKHVIVKNNDKIDAYVLAMTKKSKNLIPILEPMFEIFDEITFRNKKISEYNYMVCGQVCVGENLRGKGVFDSAYQFYKTAYEKDYDFCITEIASSNVRSLKAHERIGFEVIHQYKDKFDIDWLVVVWNWR